MNVKKVRLLWRARAEKWVPLSKGRRPETLTCCLCTEYRYCYQCPLYAYTGLHCTSDGHPFEEWLQQREIHTQYNHPEVMEAAQRVLNAIDGAIAQQEREVQHGG